MLLQPHLQRWPQYLIIKRSGTVWWRRPNFPTKVNLTTLWHLNFQSYLHGLLDVTTSDWERIWKPTWVCHTLHCSWISEARLFSSSWRFLTFPDAFLLTRIHLFSSLSKISAFSSPVSSPLCSQQQLKQSYASLRSVSWLVPSDLRLVVIPQGNSAPHCFCQNLPTSFLQQRSLWHSNYGSWPVSSMTPQEL